MFFYKKVIQLSVEADIPEYAIKANCFTSYYLANEAGKKVLGKYTQ